MIDLREINETIDEIKRKGRTVNDAVTLAMMYIARDHMTREETTAMPAQIAQNYARAAEPNPVMETTKRVKTRGTSRFLAACDGAKIDDVLGVLDEHMDAIMVLYPKEYDALVRRLEELP